MWTCHQVVNKEQIRMMKTVQITTVTFNTTWTAVGFERPRFPFSGKSGINVDLEDRHNPLEYFELFITP
jgi:hypothetical protein